MARAGGVLAGRLGALGFAMWAARGLPHAVLERLAKALEMAHAAAQQHLLQVVALLGVAVWGCVRPRAGWLDLAAALFPAGIVLFGMGIHVPPRLAAGVGRETCAVRCRSAAWA